MTDIRYDDTGLPVDAFLALAQRVWPRSVGFFERLGAERALTGFVYGRPRPPGRVARTRG